MTNQQIILVFIGVILIAASIEVILYLRNKNKWVGHIIHFVGSGETRIIVDANATSLTVWPALKTIPDTTGRIYLIEPLRHLGRVACRKRH